MMRQGPSTTRLLASITSVCIFAYVSTKRLVNVVQRLTLKRGMFGYDINKRGTPEGEVKVPEAAGLAPGCVYLVCLSILQGAHLLLGGDRAKDWALEHNSAMATIGFAIFLGFVDDVLDLPWRAKMILPAFAALPLLLSYAGSTTILVPRPIRDCSGMIQICWSSAGSTTCTCSSWSSSAVTASTYTQESTGLKLVRVRSSPRPSCSST